MGRFLNQNPQNMTEELPQPFGRYLLTPIPVYWLPMFQALRTTTFLGLLAAGIPALLFAQATGPAALPLERQPDQQPEKPAKGVDSQRCV